MPVIEHRNILFCLFDSLSLEELDVLERAGNLPSLSSLRADGMFFSRCYTPCPESSPARASLFTGLDPSVHGLWTNGVALPGNEQTFAKRLSNSGYATYLAGRYQLAGVSRWTTEQVNGGEFAEMDWAHGPLHRSRQNAYLNWLERTAPEHHAKVFTTQANPQNTIVSQQQRAVYEGLPDKLSFNHWVGERVDDWIRSASQDQPFLSVASFSTGDGLGAEPAVNADAEGLSKIALQQADAAIGQIIGQLQASNRMDDTVIIVASARGNHDPDVANTVMDERCIKVPLLIYQSDGESKVVELPVSTIDIAPTVLDLANVSVGPRMQGSSLLSAFGNADSFRNWSMTRLRATNTNGEREWYTSFCNNRMKLVIQHDKNDCEDTTRLYDLEADPCEQNNLALNNAHIAVLEDMIDQMIDARCALEDRTEPRIADF